MSEEYERTEPELQSSAQMQAEDEEADLGREPPVLPISQPSPPQPRPTEGGAEEVTSIATQTEPPPRGVSDLWGLDEEIDKWQVSAMPEEKQYFSMDPNLIDAAVTAIKSRLTAPDSNIRGAWLLTEIDHWDLEKERILVLTDNNLVSVRYHFIRGVVEELKFIPLAAITNIVFGDFKYPSSFAYKRTGKALKIFWGKVEGVGFLDRWNPFSEKVPYTIFASHLMLRKGRVDDDKLRVRKIVPLLEEAVNDLRRAQVGQSQGEASAGPTPVLSEEYHVKEEDVVIDSYVGLSAFVHNDSNLGFFKRRGFMNW